MEATILPAPTKRVIDYLPASITNINPRLVKLVVTRGRLAPEDATPADAVPLPDEDQVGGQPWPSSDNARAGFRILKM